MILENRKKQICQEMLTCENSQFQKKTRIGLKRQANSTKTFLTGI